MNVLAVTPIAVSPDELARRQERYDRLSPEGLTVQLQSLGDGPNVPRALDTTQDVESSERAVLQWLRDADVAGVDALLPDCVLDPGVDTADTGVRRPVLGLLKLTGHFLAAQGLTVAAIARNQAIAAELDRKYAAYGFTPITGGTQVLGLSVEDIANDARWDAAVAARRDESTADVMINGCSAVEVIGSDRRPLLLDPTALALQLLGVTQRSLDGIARVP